MSSLKFTSRSVPPTARNKRIYPNLLAGSSSSSPVQNVSWLEQYFNLEADLLTLNNEFAITGDTTVTGNLHVSGNITASGEIAAFIADAIESNIFDSLSVSYPLNKDGSLIGLNYNNNHFELLNNQLSINPTYLNSTVNEHIDNGNIHFAMGDITISQSQITDLDLSADYYDKASSDSRFVNASGDTITGALTVTGDLVVNGTTFTTNAQTVEIADNLLLINKNEVGSGVTNGLAGIEVERGSLINYQFLFDEASDSFKIGQVGDLQKVATREDNPLNNGFGYWNSSESRFKTKNLSVSDIASLQTNLDSKLNSASYTASDILTKIKTVDGVGSGLDADLLDGLNSTDFIQVTGGTITGTLTATTFSGSLVGNAATSTKLATARTISLTGDVAGSTTFDGSGNVSISATVGDDSHDHSQTYITDSRGAVRLPSFYNDRYAQWDFQNSADTLAGGDSWHGLLTVAKWSTYNDAHKQEQLAFTGDDLKRRTATSDTAWGAWKTILDSGNSNNSSTDWAANTLTANSINTGALNATDPLINSLSTADNVSVMQWRYSTTDAYKLRLKQTVTSGVVRWNFSQTNNNVNYEDVLVLDRGKVGIGITDPTEKLHVNGNILASGKLITNDNIEITNSNAQIPTVLSFKNYYSGTYWDGRIVSDYYGTKYNANVHHGLSFIGGRSGFDNFRWFDSGYNELMTLHKTGNLSLGAGTNPTDTGNKLHVNGNILANSISSNTDITIGGVGNGDNTPALHLKTSSGASYRAAIFANYSYANSFYLTGYEGTNILTQESGNNVTKLHNANGAGVTINGSNTYLNYGGAARLNTTSTGVSVTGDFVASGEVTAYSDRRLKSDIKPLSTAIDKINKLNPVEYTKDDKKSIGFVAQELKEIYPEFVKGEESEDTYLSVNYAQMVATLTKGMQEQQAMINNQQAMIDELKLMVLNQQTEIIKLKGNK